MTTALGEQAIVGKLLANDRVGAPNKRVPNVWADTLHYTALDPPAAGGTTPNLQEVCNEGNTTTTDINLNGGDLVLETTASELKFAADPLNPDGTIQVVPGSGSGHRMNFNVEDTGGILRNVITINEDAELTMNAGPVIIKAITGQDEVRIGTWTAGTVVGDESVNIGEESGEGSGLRSVNIGYRAGIGCDARAVCLGEQAGESSAGNSAVCVGNQAGENNVGDRCIAVGNRALATNANSDAIGIGRNAAATNAGFNSISVGQNANSTAAGQASIAIGQNAGLSGGSQSYVLLGASAGGTGAGANSVAVGLRAGAGVLQDNCIVLNASGGNQNTTNASSFVVNPVRDTSATAQSGQTDWQLNFNTTRNEISRNQGWVNSINFVASDVSMDVNSATYQILNTTGGNDWDCDLPTLSTLQVGRTFVIKNFGDNTGGEVRVRPAGTDQIEGDTSDIDLISSGRGAAGGGGSSLTLCKVNDTEWAILSGYDRSV